MLFDATDSAFQLEIDSSNFYVHEQFQDMADHPLLTNYMLGSDFMSNNVCMIKVDASITELAAQNNFDIQIPCLPGRTLELIKACL